MTTLIVPRIDTRCTQLGIVVVPPPETDSLHWELAYLWLTEGGSWETVPGWAKPFQNDHLGGDRHIYMYGVRVGGEPAKEKDLFIQWWPDDHCKFSPKEEHEWWGNVPITAGFDHAAGYVGPYGAQMNALSSSLVDGIGLPFPPYPWENALAERRVHSVVPWDGKTYHGEIGQANLGAALGGVHTSFFLVFQEVEAYDDTVDPVDPPLPPSGQKQRVLDKAEQCADDLKDHDQVNAGDLYVRIANVLSWEKFPTYTPTEKCVCP